MFTPVGFWSYARHDDRHSDGHLSQLRVIVGKAIGLRHGGDVTLWQDVTAIPFGAAWEKEIARTVGQTTFFVPIVTPRFLKSLHCHQEYVAFRERMQALGRDDLVFPIHYVDIDDLEPDDTVFGNDLGRLRGHQWIDFRQYLDTDPSSPEVRKWAGGLARGILETMRRVAEDQRRAAADVTGRLAAEKRAQGEAERLAAEKRAQEKNAATLVAHDVFLSFSREDRLAATEVSDSLERNGIRVWMESRDISPGMSWEDSLTQAIDSSRVMILILSASANSSLWLQREVERAIGKGIPVLSFRVEDVMPAKGLEHLIGAHHWLDAFDPPLERHIERLVTAVKQLLQTG